MRSNFSLRERVSGRKEQRTEMHTTKRLCEIVRQALYFLTLRAPIPLLSVTPGPQAEGGVDTEVLQAKASGTDGIRVELITPSSEDKCPIAPHSM